MYGIYSSIMSLPSFKFTNIGVPTSNERVNSGLSSSSKMEKTGILSSITEKAQDTFKELKQMPDMSLDTNILGDGGDGGDGDGGDGSIFSFTNAIKLILIIVIAWFMWSSLSDNSDFHLGMGEFGSKLKTFVQSMEDKGRELVSRITNTPLTSSSSTAAASAGNDSDSDSDSDSDGDGDAHHAPSASASASSSSSAPHRPPVPPSMSNSSDKKPGFIHDDDKYTFLDKADRSYTGPSPRADDSTSVTQKHQAGKSGYCYIGEDRGFRSCVKVEAGDKCMSGQVFSRQDICVNPTLRE